MDDLSGTMNQRRLLQLFGLCIVLLCASVRAETVYVSDQLVITLRADPADGAEILEHLRTGEALEVLQRPQGGNFLKVRTVDGVEGWALSQYLMPAPAARDQLEAARAELSSVKQQLQTTRVQLEAREAELAQTNAALTQTRSDLQTSSQQLAELRQTAGSSLELLEENADLTARLERAATTVATLEGENAGLRSESNRQWFLTGAGVLGGGIIVGWILARLIRRRRWEW